MVSILLVCAVSYSIGAIPTSFVLARLIKGIDIREYGSGNVGATNLMRIAGRGPAILALLLDILKGVVAVTLVAGLIYRLGSNVDFETFRLISGLAAPCGHIWPASLKFKGGKGAATTVGVLLVIAPKVIGIALLIWFLTVVFTRYVSLGSILGAISLPITAALLGNSLKVVFFCIILCFIGTYKHKSNIRRLLRKEEPKVGYKFKVK